MIDQQTLQKIRKEYMAGELSKKTVSPDPVPQFTKWFDEALHISETELEVNSVTLATATKDGLPAARMVLLKHFDEEGFTIYTNYNSDKAKELAENPRAALLFYWPQLQRQVRVKGVVEKVTTEESEAYFKTRPYGSRISAWASQQSAAIENREVLENRFEEFQKKYPGKNVPLPPFWGGYRIIPNRYEFWQGRENRLHDRVQYTLVNSVWQIERLAP